MIDKLIVIFASTIWTIGVFEAKGQDTLVFQGGENGDCWNYSADGAERVTDNPRSGNYAIRIGGLNEPTTINFEPVHLEAFSGLRFSVAHRTDEVPPRGPGMDNNENLHFEVRLNSGSWTTIGVVSGGADYSYDWTTTQPGFDNDNCIAADGGSYGGINGRCSTPCATCPNNSTSNPLSYNIPDNTTLFEFRARLLDNSGNLVAFNRLDEFYFLDDVFIVYEDFDSQATVDAPENLCEGEVLTLEGVQSAFQAADLPQLNYQWQLDGRNLPENGGFSGTNERILAIDGQLKDLLKPYCIQFNAVSGGCNYPPFSATFDENTNIIQLPQTEGIYHQP